MMLQTGNESIRFKPRPVEGVSLNDGQEPEWYILDGQQRLTSLFQAILLGRAVETQDSRGKKIKRFYYINIGMALNLDADREEAIIGLPEDKKVRNFRGEVLEDFSSPEKEYEVGLFPLTKILDCADWRSDFEEYWDYEREKIILFNSFEKEVIKRFEQYQLPLITLRKEIPKEAVCRVFEKVNTGGVSLTVFELLTATFAADDFNLRKDWKVRKNSFDKDSYQNIQHFESTDFLQGITLLSTYDRRQQFLQEGHEGEKIPGISCKRKDILKLSLDDYRTWADRFDAGVKRASRFLSTQKIFSARDVPYRTQLTPLSAILAILGEEAENDGVRQKLAQWYWCGVLGEQYGSAIETRSAKDLPEVIDWIHGGQLPSTIMEANFNEERLLSLRTRNSAAYKGLYALLIKDGCQDFRSGDTINVQQYFDDKIDIHHIFPHKWCDENSINMNLCNSILNKTPLSARTNRIIGGRAPSEYITRVQHGANIDDERMGEILRSHAIEPELLRANDFKGFIEHRKMALLKRIEGAIGKQVIREQELNRDSNGSGLLPSNVT